jgi:hypothetical protein
MAAPSLPPLVIVRGLLLTVLAVGVALLLTAPGRGAALGDIALLVLGVIGALVALHLLTPAGT